MEEDRCAFNLFGDVDDIHDLDPFLENVGDVDGTDDFDPFLDNVESPGKNNSDEEIIEQVTNVTQQSSCTSSSSSTKRRASRYLKKKFVPEKETVRASISAIKTHLADAGLDTNSLSP